MSKKEKSREIKPVSFNMLDPEEKELYEYATRENPLTGKPQNFSKFVRRLIAEEKRREERGYTNNNNSSGLTIIDVQNDDDETYTLEVKNAINSFL